MDIRTTVAERDREAFTCSPPADEMDGDGPARTQQHREYQSIMKSGRLQQICNMVGALKI